MVRTDVTFFYMTGQPGTDRTKPEPVPVATTSSSGTPKFQYVR